MRRDCAADAGAISNALQHALDAYLDAYLDAAALGPKKKSPLFPTLYRRQALSLKAEPFISTNRSLSATLVERSRERAEGFAAVCFILGGQPLLGAKTFNSDGHGSVSPSAAGKTREKETLMSRSMPYLLVDQDEVSSSE